MKPATSSTSISSLVSLEDEEEKRKVGTEKMSFVLQELVETEKEYVDKMHDVIKVGMTAHVIQINHINVYRTTYQRCFLLICRSL